MDDTPAPGLRTRLQQHAAAQPDACAVAADHTQLSYAELDQRVHRCARALAGDDVDGPGSDHYAVGIQSADDLAHLVVSLALTELGVDQFTVPSGTDPARARQLLGDGMVVRVLGEDQVARLHAAACRLPADKTAMPRPPRAARLLMATSGTTGAPKIVVLDTTDIVSQAPRHIESPQDRFACLATMEHNFVKRHRLYCVAQGATNVLLPADRAALVDCCGRLDVRTLHVSAYQARELLALAPDAALRRLRLKLGGSHVPLDLRQALCERITPNLYTGYGTTETGAIAFAGPDQHDADESVGQPLPGMELRLLGPDRKPVAPGATGLIAVRCSGLFRGYLDDPERTRQRYRDGWFHTGDIGHLTDDGRLCVSGRADDMFVFNSLNIYPQEIEALICQHPDVADAAVLPRPSSVHGDIPVALVVAAAGCSLDMRQLRDFTRERTGLRCPRQFTPVDAIPRNASGKIRRDAALALLNAPT